MGTIVKNLNGTSDNQCKCGSWIKHYAQFSDFDEMKILLCSVIDCKNPSLIGGHVQKVNDENNHWYIVPLCKTCNGNKNHDFEIYQNDEGLASANVSETCGN